MSHACHRFWTCDKTLTFCAILDKVHNPLHLPRETTSERPKVVRREVFLAFSLANVLRTQLRALFWHRNFQKYSEARVFCAFWLGNVLRATTACNFLSLIWPDGSAPAALASLLRPSGATNQWKNTVFHHFLPYLVAHLDLLSSDSFSFFFSSLTLPMSAFHLSILSEVWLLNFFSNIYNLRNGEPKRLCQLHLKADWPAKIAGQSLAFRSYSIMVDRGEVVVLPVHLGPLVIASFRSINGPHLENSTDIGLDDVEWVTW